MQTNAVKYRIETFNFNRLDKDVVLPSFQRKLVWSKIEKKNFIKTLSRGHPFGSILVYKYPHEEKISLIDGLQRFTTIRDYRDNPQDYIEIDEFVEETLKILVDDSLPTTTKTSYKRTIEQIYKEFIGNLNEDQSSTDLLERLEGGLDFCEVQKNFKPILKIQDGLRRKIRNHLDILTIDIPTIVFTGSDTELATVFENLNRGGKKLSKYQVFAAQWYKYEVKLSTEYYNRELLKRTIDWYEELENERGIEIENFNAELMKKESKINIAELCFAFGQIILESTPVFWNQKDKDTANEIGYSTMAIILGIKNKDLSTIIKEDNKSLFDDSNLIENILKEAQIIYKDINEFFGKYLHTPGNVHDYKHASGSNFQILSYFAALWNIRYQLNRDKSNLQSKTGSNKEYERVLKNLLKWHIHDTVTGYWSGTGDSKLDQIAIENNNKYRNQVEKEELEGSLKRWYSEQLQKRSINFESTAKMLYTINASFDRNQYKSSKYDLEHVIPKKMISKVPNTVSIPAGSLGNLMFLDVSTNRGKKEKFLYEYINEETSNVKPEFVSLHFYPRINSLMDVKNEIESTGNDYSNTQSVIKNRGNEILNALIKNIYY